jgi:hypothetical protein
MLEWERLFDWRKIISEQYYCPKCSESDKLSLCEFKDKANYTIYYCKCDCSWSGLFSETLTKDEVINISRTRLIDKMLK